MLKQIILTRLNEQMNRELFSAYLYFAMMGYFESVNLKGFSSWMRIQATEELTHTLRIFNYINDKSARAEMGGVEKPQNEWDSPFHAMESAYNHECFISEQINECVSLALAENDFSTNTFLQWFVAEQVEEEANADDIVQKLKLIGDNSSGLYLLDAELGKRTLGLEDMALTRGGGA